MEQGLQRYHSAPLNKRRLPQTRSAKCETGLVQVQVATANCPGFCN